MDNKLQVITTVGTSLFDNYKKACAELGTSFLKPIEIAPKIKNGDAQNISFEKKNSRFSKGIDVSNIKNAVSDFFITAKIKAEKKQDNEWHWTKDNEGNFNTHASAEIKSIIKIWEENSKPEMTIQLLCTDTVLSVLAAQIIKEWVDSEKVKTEYQGIKIEFNYQSDYVPKLKVDNANKNQLFEGLDNLIEKIRKYTEKQSSENVILNITGGYKGFIPILTIVAQLEGFTLNYLYEEGEDVISIKRLPISFDWSIAEIYHEYLTNKDLLKTLSEEDEILEYLKHSGSIDSDRKLTTLGKLFSEYIKKHLPERSDVLGHYMEHKLFYYFFENEYNGYKSNKLGMAFWRDKTDTTKYSENPMYNKNKYKEERVEIDIELKDAESNKVWIECKALSSIGKAAKQVEKYIDFNKKALKQKLREIIIFTYKFEFQIINENKLQSFKDAIVKCKNENIVLKILYCDIPYNKSKGTITYKNVFDKKLDLTEIQLTE